MYSYGLSTSQHNHSQYLVHTYYAYDTCYMCFQHSKTQHWRKMCEEQKQEALSRKMNKWMNGRNGNSSMFCAKKRQWQTGMNSRHENGFTKEKWRRWEMGQERKKEKKKQGRVTNFLLNILLKYVPHSSSSPTNNVHKHIIYPCVHKTSVHPQNFINLLDVERWWIL